MVEAWFFLRVFMFVIAVNYYNFYVSGLSEFVSEIGLEILRGIFTCLWALGYAVGH